MKYPTFSISLAIWKLLTDSQGTNGQSTTRGSYVPVTNVHCPDVFTRRTLDQQFQLDPREREYIDGRRALLPEAWSQWLRDPSTLGYSAQDLKLVSGADVPSIALASSGGSFRSALFSAGALTAFDIRNDTAKAIGTGGLLQVSQYHSGLSGGSWIATSLAINDLPVPRDLVLGNVHQGGNLTGWLLDRDLLLPDGIRAIDFYEDIVDQVRSKANAGFDTGLTDIWSRALAYHLLPGTSELNFFSDDESTHGAGVLYSDLQKIPRFTQKQMPFPLIVVNARPPLFEDAPPGTNLPLESTVYEVTPFEFGSYDPHLAAFVDVKYLGTELNELKPKSSDSCVTNFDQADFVAGSSSSLFFALLYDSRRKLNGIEAKAADFLFKALNNLLKGISTRADDVGVVPNVSKVSVNRILACRIENVYSHSVGLEWVNMKMPTLQVLS
ncbi:Lysophospholipase 1 [Serendipita sp. 397]|nr:Lysophospholipase 1 [Serendipita sp. 397]